MDPHAASPHVVWGGTPPWRDTLYPQQPGGCHWLGTALTELLAEPTTASPGWLSALYGRLCVAATGAILVADQGPGAERLERAGWLRCAPDVDANAARRGAWPTLDEVTRLGLGVGSLAPNLVLVAERDPYDRLPMFARSGTWLFRALRLLGYDELTIYVTNALDRAGRSQPDRLGALRDAFAPYDPTWVSLGGIASEALTLAGVEHAAAPHPAHARRFAFQAGPQGYAAQLEKAGLRPGPWQGQTLPSATGDLALALRLGLPRTTTVGLAKVKKPLVAADVLERVRTRYVVGQAATVKAAAEGEDPKLVGKLKRAAKQQGWDRERDRYLADRRERVKATSAEEESKRIASARGLAWEVAEKMLARINESLAAPDAQVSARDAKAVGDLALALSERGDATYDDEKRRLGQLSPEAFQAELRKVLGGYGVTEPAAQPPPGEVGHGIQPGTG